MQIYNSIMKETTFEDCPSYQEVKYVQGERSSLEEA